MTTTVRTRALGRGKVILAGEHAVVYGSPAIAVSLDRGVEASAVPAPESELCIAPWGVRARPDGASDDPIARAFHALLLERARWQPASGTAPHLAVDADVSIPAGAGLGCSAALGVAIVKALGAADGVALSPDEAAAASMAWERVFHGAPSGVDSAAASREGALWFERADGGNAAPRIASLHLRAPLHLVIADSGEPSSTKVVVDAVRRRHDADRVGTEKIFVAIAAIVRNARLALEAGDLGGVGRLLDANHSLLAALLLSTERIEQLVHVARGAGALGAKLTGAGGGGCVIALAEGEAHRRALEEALRPHAALVFGAPIGRAESDAVNPREGARP